VRGSSTILEVGVAASGDEECVSERGVTSGEQEKVENVDYAGYERASKQVRLGQRGVRDVRAARLEDYKGFEVWTSSRSSSEDVRLK
jgi:hypothetical protein